MIIVKVIDRIEETIKKVLPINHNTSVDIPETLSDIMQIIGNIFIPVSAPLTWLCTDIIRTKHGYELYWLSISDSACCPHCKQVSTTKSNTYFTRRFQDLPIQNMAIFHNLTIQRYDCLNPHCECANFFEQYEDMVDMHARSTNAFQDYVCRLGVESNAEGTARVLKSQGVKISGDTILRMIKNKGLTEMKQQLENDDIVTFGCDDINRRKGNSNTACTVFIDADTHRFIMLVAGKGCEVVEEFLKSHPSVEIMTRDRSTAYAKAGRKAGIKQVADRFHLYKNLHDAIKKEIYDKLPLKVILRDIRSESDLPDTGAQPKNTCEVDNSNLIDATTKSKNEKLANLTGEQKWHYETIKRIHTLRKSGMSPIEISQQESLPYSRVGYYLGIDPETLLSKSSRKEPSSKSIAAPYKETIVRMMNEGKKHREIFKAVQKEGFTGCRNCIYQYIKKYTEENNIPYGRSKQKAPDKLEISRKVIYDKLIRLTSNTLKDDVNEDELLLSDEENSNSECMENSSTQSNDVSDTDVSSKKNITNEQYDKIKEQYPVLEYLETVRIDFYKIFSTKDVTKLDDFIDVYMSSDCKNIALFARELKKDYDAVALAVTSPLSNGPTEGINNKIKAFCRQMFGRAGNGLLNAKMVLSTLYCGL